MLRQICGQRWFISVPRSLDIFPIVSYWFVELSKALWNSKLRRPCRYSIFFVSGVPLRHCEDVPASIHLRHCPHLLHQSDPKSPHSPLVAPLRAPYHEVPDSKMSIRALLCNAWHLMVSAGCCGFASSVGQEVHLNHYLHSALVSIFGIIGSVNPHGGRQSES